MTELEGASGGFIANLRSHEAYDYVGFLAGLKADPAYIGRNIVRVAMTPADAFYSPEKPIRPQEQIDCDKNMLIDEVLELYERRLRKGEPLSERQRTQAVISRMSRAATQAYLENATSRNNWNDGWFDHAE